LNNIFAFHGINGMLWSVAKKHPIALDLLLRKVYISRDRSDSKHRALSSGRLSSYPCYFISAATLKSTALACLICGCPVEINKGGSYDNHWY